MKIPSSSSLLFATLAISSSSSSLAAPAGDSAHSEGMSDARQSSFTARRASMVDRSDIRSAHDSRQLDPVVSLVDGLPIVGPILQPILTPIVGAIFPKAGAASVRRDQLNMINSVTQLPGNITQLLPVPLPSSIVPGVLPTGILSHIQRSEPDGVTDGSSDDASYTSTATDAPPSATQGSMTAAAIPLPSNPVTPIVGSLVPVNPQIPSLPVPLPGLPIPVPSPLANLPAPLNSLPLPHGRRSEADEVADSSSVSTSCTSTATDASSSATQGSMVAAGLPLPSNPVTPIVGGLIPVNPQIPSLPIPVPSSLPVNLPVPNSPPLLSVPAAGGKAM